MRFYLILSLFMVQAMAFVPAIQKSTKVTTELNLERRDVLITGVMGLIAAPAIAQAKASSTTFFDDEQVREQSQMPTDGKIDLNSAFVGEYKYLPGFFPTAAGKVASNGPYEKVSDIYKIEGLTDNDKMLFKKYEKYFTVNPPGRAFDERINARVST